MCKSIAQNYFVRWHAGKQKKIKIKKTDAREQNLPGRWSPNVQTTF